jgi:hypothetical protein
MRLAALTAAALLAACLPASAQTFTGTIEVPSPDVVVLATTTGERLPLYEWGMKGTLFDRDEPWFERFEGRQMTIQGQIRTDAAGVRTFAPIALIEPAVRKRSTKLVITEPGKRVKVGGVQAIPFGRAARLLSLPSQKGKSVKAWVTIMDFGGGDAFVSVYSVKGCVLEDAPLYDHDRSRGRAKRTRKAWIHGAYATDRVSFMYHKTKFGLKLTRLVDGLGLLPENYQRGFATPHAYVEVAGVSLAPLAPTPAPTPAPATAGLSGSLGGTP